jgi:preprotein translocase subunit SecB
MNRDLALAARIGRHAELFDVRQLEVAATLHRATTEPLNANVGHNLRWSRAESVLVCQLTFQIDIADSVSGEEVFEGRLTIVGAFLLHEPCDDDDACDAFARTSGQMMLFPYAREAVQNLTVRAGLPPYMLAPFQLELDVDDVKGPTPSRTKAKKKAPGLKPAPPQAAPAKKAAAKKVAPTAGKRPPKRA